MKKIIYTIVFLTLMTSITHASSLETNPIIESKKVGLITNLLDSSYTKINMLESIIVDSEYYYQWEIKGKYSSAKGTSESYEKAQKLIKLININDIALSVIIYKVAIKNSYL